MAKLYGKHVRFASKILINLIFKMLSLTQFENTPKINILQKVVSKSKYEGFFFYPEKKKSFK